MKAPAAMRFRHETRTTWTTRDDLDGHFLFATGRADEPGNCPAGGTRQRHGVCVENSSEQVIQVIQVILTPLSQRLLATITVVQFSAVASQAVPAQAGPAGRGLARSRPPRGGLAMRSVFSMGRSYACGVDVGGDIDDLQ
jgi:hypothetical protein